MNKFSWYSIPAIQLSNDVSQLFKVSAPIVATVPQLLSFSSDKTLSLYDINRQLVMKIPLSNADKFSTIQDMLLDIDRDSITDIPVYLPTTVEHIGAYFSGIAPDITNINQFMAYLQYLLIANYLNDVTQLTLLVRKIAEYLQSLKVRQYLEQNPTVIDQWLTFFNQQYPPELSLLIARALPLTSFDVFFMQEHDRPRGGVYAWYNWAMAGTLFSSYFLEHYYTEPYIKDIKSDHLVDNPNLTNAFLAQNIGWNADIRYTYIPTAYQASLALEEAPQMGNTKLNWALVKDHLTETFSAENYRRWQWTVSQWHHIATIADPQWIVDNLKIFEQMNDDRILEFLSKNLQLTPAFVTKYLDLDWDWNFLTKNAAMTKEFIQTTRDDPRYYWRSNQLLYNPNFKPLEVYFGSPVDQYALNTLMMANPNWTWPDFKKYLIKYVSPAIYKQVSMQHLFRRKWVQIEDIEDILQFFGHDSEHLWNDFISQNPNLTEAFILQHLDLFIQTSDSLGYIIEHSAFTPALWQLLVDRYGSAVITADNYGALADNINFGAIFMKQHMTTYIELNKDWPKNMSFRVQGRAFDSIEEYLRFILP